MYYLYLSKGCQAMAVWPWCMWCLPGFLSGGWWSEIPVTLERTRCKVLQVRRSQLLACPPFPDLHQGWRVCPHSRLPAPTGSIMLWYIRIEWDVEKSTDIVSQKFFFFSPVNGDKKKWPFCSLKGQFWRVETYRHQLEVIQCTMLSIFAEPLKCWHRKKNS